MAMRLMVFGIAFPMRAMVMMRVSRMNAMPVMAMLVGRTRFMFMMAMHMRRSHFLFRLTLRRSLAGGGCEYGAARGT